MGRTLGQSEWRSTRHDVNEKEIRREAAHSSLCDPTIKMQEPNTDDFYDPHFWSGWPSCYPRMLRDSLYLWHGDAEDRQKYFQNAIEETQVQLLTSNAEGDTEAANQIENTEPDLDVQYSSSYSAYQKARESEDFLSALEYLGRCIELKGLASDLDEATNLPLIKDSAVEIIHELEDLPRETMKFALKRKPDTNDAASFEINLNQVARCCSTAYAKTSHSTFPLLEGIARFHETSIEEAEDNECISAFDNSLPKGDNDIQFYLGISFQRNFRLTRREMDRNIASQYLERFAKQYNYAELIGFLFEKGCLVGRDSQRLSEIENLGYYEDGANLARMILFLFNPAEDCLDESISTVAACGFQKSTQSAVAIYQSIRRGSMKKDGIATTGSV